MSVTAAMPPAVINPGNPTLFTLEQHSNIDKNRIPKHIAFIPDGNRRWAKEKGTSTFSGHENGADILIDVVKAAKELQVESLTFYTFSTENWQRPEEEVNALMWLIKRCVEDHKEAMQQEGIRLQTIGDLSPIPEETAEAIQKAKEATASGTCIDLILAINYGGRDELCRAIRRVYRKVEQGHLTLDDINEDVISEHLDTAPWGDPELLIRTSGEHRISNFLVWQLSYTEFYTPKIYWPEFKPQHLYEAILAYQQRKRRLGQ